MFSGIGGKYNSSFVNRIVTLMNVEKVLVTRYKVSKSYYLSTAILVGIVRGKPNVFNQFFVRSIFGYAPPS